MTLRDLTPGLELGARFVLIRRVADGGGSQVWLAEDRQLDRRVALKIVAAGLLERPGARARLAAEMERARLLEPGHSVEILGLHESDGLLLLEMEYLAGGDLGQFRGRSFAVFAPALRDVARALAAAHQRGLVHRDLKCANVLLDAEGHARLADFGLATLAGAAAGGGSPYSMSPQQLRGEAASAADDLYAFGAMLYELLAGHPPYYPDFNRDRVLHDPVPALVPRAPAPERARLLALRLLSKSPAARPADMTEVDRELAEAMAEPVGESAAAPPSRPSPPAGSRPARERPASRRGPLIALALACLAGFGYVLVWLPQQVAEREAVDGGDAVNAALADAERAREAQQDSAARAEARVAAAKLREDFAKRLAAIEKQGAATWATAALATARAQDGDATRHYDLQDYTAAGDAWQSAMATLEGIESGRPAALAAALAAGEKALAGGQSAAAERHFRLALVIEPGHAAAGRGLQRAGRLDEVFALLDAAARDERAGRIEAARSGLRQALEIDAEAPGARQALARIDAREAGEAFAALMSRGLAAMAEGRTAAARTDFEKARAMRPGSGEVRDALEELARSEKARDLRQLTEQALAAEGQENWKAAHAAWTGALALESTLAPARAGIDRVAPRIELDARIDGFMNQPDQLWTEAGRAQARRLIAAAQAAAPPRDRLDARTGRLAAMVQAAVTPVRLELLSDGATEVVIYRVGRIGAFQRHQLELLPGRYAVVGTRPGYRDVRRELEILPGSEPGPVTVRCEERI